VLVVLRRIFGPKREEVVGVWRKVHNEELHNLCTAPNIVRVVKSRRMRRVGQVARMGEMRNAYKDLAGKPEGEEHSEDLRVYGRMILKWIFGK